MTKPLFLLMLCVGIACAQSEIVVDNRAASFDGPWGLGKSSKDRYGDDYKSAFCVAGAATATATYRPEITVPGKYNVEVMYPRGDNRSAKAPWLISYSGGSFTTNISQKVRGGTWVRIGNALDFAPGGNNFVRLSNDTGEDQDTSIGKTVVIADAVRFTLVTRTDAVDGSATAETPAKQETKRSSTWQFTATTAVRGEGSVSVLPEQPGYAAGDVVEFTAKANNGNVFVGWTGDASGLDNPLSLKIKKNTIVTAEFLPEALGSIIESSEADLHGSWATNSQKWIGQRTDSYAFASASQEATASATFRPNLPKPGKYDIYIYYLAGENRAAKTTWEIVSKTGHSTSEVDQRTGERQWTMLAPAVAFDGGTSGYVKVTNKAEPLSSVVVADSVAFVYVAPLD